MPVTVHIPTRIRLDRRALDEHPEWLDTALSAALGRALDNSRNKVLKLRGDYVAVNVNAPTFTWKGVVPPAAERAALERRVAGLLADLANAHAIGTPPASDPPPVMPPNPSEAYDPLRGSSLAGLYAIDSYGGNDTVLPVDKEHPLLYDYIPAVRVFSDAINKEIIAQLTGLAASATPEHPLGLIYRYAQGDDIRWQVLITDGLADDPEDKPHIAGLFSFDGFFRLEYMGAQAAPAFQRVGYTPPPGPASAEVFELPADLAGRNAKYKALLGPALLDSSRRHARKPVNVTTAAFDAGIAERVDKHISEQVSRLADIGKGVEVKLGTALAVVWIGSDTERFLAWNGRANLSALETVVPVPKPKATTGPASGGTAGGQAGAAGRRGGAKGSGDCPPDEIGLPNGLTGDEGPGTAGQPLRGEPALDELGDAGALLDQQMQAIATGLALTAGTFAGQFCCQAATVLNQEALACQGMAESASGENAPRGATRGNLGTVDFTPGTSKIIGRVRELAAVVPMISQLMAAIVDVLLSDLFRCSIHGTWRGKGASWSLRFLEDAVPMLQEAVGNLFIAATRSSLLQLLATSLEQIRRRQKAIDRYAPLFEKWILPYLVELAELDLLHRLLSAYLTTKKQTAVAAAVVGATAESWGIWQSRLVATLVGDRVVRSAGIAFDIVDDGEVARIRGTNNVLWSLEELETAMAFRRGAAEGIDPLVKQIIDTPEAVKSFKGTAAVRTELDTLLAKMARNNLEMQLKTTRDPRFAFKASAITEDIPQATLRGGKYALQGIHHVAHEQIGDAFGNDDFYASGLNRLFDSEEGWEAIKTVGIMSGFVLLCVLVPGGAYVAFLAGGALAAAEVRAAYEKKRLYQALIDPDKVLSHADVEVALFVAWFGAVMSLIPESGTAARGLIASGKAVLKGEAKGLAKLAGKAAAKRLSRELVEYAAKDLLEAFVKELALNLVITEVIQKVLEPLIEQIQAQAALRSAATGAARAPDPAQIEFIKALRAIELAPGAADDAGEAD